MRGWLAAALLFPVVAVALAACGDGPDPVPTPTPTRAAATPPAGSPTIPPPDVPSGNIDAIRPQHGARIPQAQTRSPDPNNPANGLPENFQWVRMFFDDTEVTVSPDILLIAPTTARDQAPQGGTMCYMPRDGLSVGVHTVTVGIQNPRNPQEPTRQVVQWQFEVTP
jgi:hypothetical protein